MKSKYKNKDRARKTNKKLESESEKTGLRQRR